MAAPDVLTAEVMQMLQVLGSGAAVFRIMIVGEQGLGKSTLVSCLLQVQKRGARLEVQEGGAWVPVQHLPGGDSTQAIRRYRYTFEGVELGHRLTTTYEIVDTPGFASQINSHNSWLSKLEVIERGIKGFCDREATSREDPRVHLCIYMLAPLPRPLRELDKRVLLELQRWVPVMPVIAKADTFTAEDLRLFQQKLQEEFRSHGLLTLADMSESPVPAMVMECDIDIPLAIITSSQSYKRSSNTLGWEQCEPLDEGAQFGRLYRWGLAVCDENSDLGTLRKIVTTARHFIVQRCDQMTGQWSRERKAMIKCLAEIFCRIVAFDYAYQKWRRDYESALCKDCCPPEPKFEDSANWALTPSAQHWSDAEKEWDRVFEAGFTDMRSELFFHASFCGDSVTSDIEQRLIQMYVKQAVARTNQASYPSSTISGRYDVHVRDALKKLVQSGAVKSIIAEFVAGLAHRHAGVPLSLARAVAREAASVL